MTELGEKIRFVGGQYEGLTGWLDVGRAATGKMVPVIVDKGEGGCKATSVQKENVLRESEYKAPRCYEEAIFDCHPSINKTLKKLCKNLAECGLEEPNMMTALFKLRLQRAIEKQKRLGSKAI
ncbi:hypothetical protein ACA910_008358 [Epithemia clementina (nom. ined.)]